MKHFVSLAFFLVVGFAVPVQAFDACNPDAIANYKKIDETYSNGLLFQVSKCGVTDSYVFGTYHSDNEMMWNNAQTAIGYLKVSTLAVFEVLDANDPNIVQNAMFFSDDSQENLQDLLGDKDFNTLYSRMQLVSPMPPEALRKLRPWAASVLLQAPKDSTGKGILDDRLKEIANQAHIPLAPLESLNEQFEVFTKLSTDEQLTLLRDALGNIDQLNAFSQQIDQAYLAQDLRMLAQLADSGFRLMMDVALKDKLIKNLITDRNANMANRVIPYVDKGGAFIAIGALHLMGNGGVLPELESQGYFITPMR